MWAVTDRSVEDSEEERWEDVRTRIAGAAKNKGSVDTANAEGKRNRGGRTNRYAPPTKYPPTMRVEGSASTSEGTATKEATAHGQAGGGVWLGLAESGAAFTDVDQERSCSKFDTVQNSSSRRRECSGPFRCGPQCAVNV